MLGVWHLRGPALLLVTLVKAQLMSLLPQASKVNFWFNAKLSKHVRHAEEKRRKIKERPFGHWVWLREKHTKSWSRVCEFHRVSQKHRDIQPFEVQYVCRDREKHSESVREWKRKKETFFFALVTHKEDKLVEFSWNIWVLQLWRVGVFRGQFCYWFCGEIVFTP